MGDDRLEKLREAIQQRAIFLGKDHPVVSPKGHGQGWLIDLRMTLLDGASLELIADLFWERFAGRLPFQVGGLEAGSIPLVVAIGMFGAFPVRSRTHSTSCRNRRRPSTIGGSSSAVTAGCSGRWSRTRAPWPGPFGCRKPAGGTSGPRPPFTPAGSTSAATMATSTVSTPRTAVSTGDSPVPTG